MRHHPQVAALTAAVGVVQRAKPGNLVSGDAWCLVEDESGLLLCVCDGLGSGEHAHLAAQAQIDTVRRCADRPLPDILEACHTALLSTRGAAAALLRVDTETRRVSYAGVGNVEARTRRDWPFHPLSMRGIVGANNFRPPRVYEADYVPGEWIVLHTDGLRSRFDLELELLRAAQSGLLGGGPQALAESLCNDHARENDDLTVVVMQLP
ncbi:MAG: SpoIIE family protein phosphatase [Armatimonadetes bacterium]|nr:SpoIIE family protein phosphatase [Armatimonadota bacterium]